MNTDDSGTIDVEISDDCGTTRVNYDDWDHWNELW